MAQIQLISNLKNNEDIHYANTKVLVDGEILRGVQSVKFEQSVNSAPILTLTLINPSIEIDGEFTKEKTIRFSSEQT